jgi:hypothetical protein
MRSSIKQNFEDFFFWGGDVVWMAKGIITT